MGYRVGSLMLNHFVTNDVKNPGLDKALRSIGHWEPHVYESCIYRPPRRIVNSVESRVNACLIHVICVAMNRRVIKIHVNEQRAEFKTNDFRI